VRLERLRIENFVFVELGRVALIDGFHHIVPACGEGLVAAVVLPHYAGSGRGVGE